MKRLLPLLALSAVAGAASATDFTTIVFLTGNGTATPPVLGETFVETGNEYRANFASFSFTPNSAPSFIDVQWTHSFDTTIATGTSPVSAPFTSVTQTLFGRIRRATGTGTASVTAVLSESVTDSNGLFAGTNAGEFDFSTASAEFVPFQFSLTVPFNRPLASGFSIKDDLVLRPSDGAEVFIDSIAQNYNPVPEPASMAALGLGALALLRRRRR